MNSIFENMECNPLNNNTELLNFISSGKKWEILINPIVPRCSPRILGKYWYMLDSANDVELVNTDENRAQVLVCHDLMGNYRNDR